MRTIPASTPKDPECPNTPCPASSAPVPQIPIAHTSATLANVRSLLVASMLAVASFGPSLALAAPSATEVNAARETYREGIALEAAGNWAAALAKFREVAAVKSTARVRFHIGLCQENLGRWTEALGAYKLAFSDAEREGAADVAKEAESARAKLDRRIPRLTVRSATSAAGASVSLDGVALGSSSLGAEMPVDPGTHTIESAMPGRTPWRTTIELREGDNKSVEAQMPSAAKDGSSAAPAVTSSRSAIVEPPPRSALPWIAFGLGAASLATSGVFFVMRQGIIQDLEDKCGPELRCSEAERSTYDRGSTYGTIAGITLGVGALGVGLGTVLLLTTGRRDESAGPAPARGPVPPSVGLRLHPSGASLVGSF